MGNRNPRAHKQTLFQNAKLFVIMFTCLLTLGLMAYQTLKASAGTTDMPLSVSLDTSNRQIKLSWTDPGGGIVKTDIFRSTNNKDFALLASTTTSAGTIYYDSKGLVPGTTYFYNLKGYDSGSNVVGSSTTQSITMRLAAQIVSVAPRNHDVNIGLDETSTGNTIKILFNQPMNPTSLQSGINVTANGSSTAATIDYNNLTNTATVWVGGSSKQFAPLTQYLVTVTTGVTIATTNPTIALQQPYSWSFKTAATSQAYSPHGGYSVATGQCSSCHVTHTALGPNLVQQSNTEETCNICHNGTQASDSDYFGSASGQTGQTVYDKVGHGQSGINKDCQSCHDPHANKDTNANLYISDGTTDGTLAYSQALSSPDLTTYNGANFTLCTSCHTEFKQYPSTPMTSAQTAFYDTGNNQDLHWLHLVDAGTIKDPNASGNYGNAVCYDCHRPHGAIASDNAAIAGGNQSYAHMVGFPSAAVATTNNTIMYYGTASGGGCTLVCHDVVHINGVVTTSPTITILDSQYSK